MNTRIIVNADDFGLSVEVNEEIIRLIRLGTVSSTTVLANATVWMILVS